MPNLMKRPGIAATCMSVFLLLLSAQKSAADDPLPLIAPEEAGFSTERLNRLSSGIDEMVANGTIAGAVTVIARHGKIVYFEADGFRDIEANDPMAKSDLFRIASMTKPVTAVATLSLVEKGKLLLSDPVSKYLPEFGKTTVAVAEDDRTFQIVPAERQITIADLLKHTSGYGYGFGGDTEAYKKAGLFGWYFMGEDRTIREYVDDLSKLPAEAQPGSAWTYGYSYDILGAVIEVVSGKTLDVFLKEAIFDPIGMEDTSFFYR